MILKSNINANQLFLTACIWPLTPRQKGTRHSYTDITSFRLIQDHLPFLYVRSWTAIAAAAVAVAVVAHPNPRFPPTIDRCLMTMPMADDANADDDWWRYNASAAVAPPPPDRAYFSCRCCCYYDYYCDNYYYYSIAATRVQRDHAVSYSRVPVMRRWCC